MGKKLLEVAADAGSAVLKAATGYDAELAAKREAARDTLAMQGERDTEVKRAAGVLAECDRKVTLGLTFPGATIPLTEAYKSACLAVAECKEARKFLLDTAPHELQFAHRGNAKSRAAASTRVRNSESDLADSRERHSKVAEALQELEGTKPTFNAGDAASSKLQSQNEYDRQLRSARHEMQDSESRVAQAEIEVTAAKRASAEACDAYEKSLAAMLAA